MNWKRVLVFALSCFLGIYLILAATVFNKSSKLNVTCKNVHITIEKGVIEGFLTPAEIQKMLAADNINPVGNTLNQINTRVIEEKLQSKELIEKAECYKTQSGNLCISVKERIPVMHVMAANGEDYYVDNMGNQMSNPDYVCNLMIATGNINRKYARRVLAPIGKLVMQDPFWRNEIVQLNVLADETLEMIPRVGDHVVYLGKPVGIKRKLERLRKFYKYGLNQAGWNIYSRISVELDNQIICKKKTNEAHNAH